MNIKCKPLAMAGGFSGTISQRFIFPHRSALEGAPCAGVARGGVFLLDGCPNFCSFLLTATNGGTIPLLKFSGLETDKGAPLRRCCARGGVSYGRVA
jgi:hypothetical protein